MFFQMMYKDRNLVWAVFQGSFTNTTLYHGYYTNESGSIVDGLTYRMPPAYFFTVLACYFFIFVVLSIRWAQLDKLKLQLLFVYFFIYLFYLFVLYITTLTVAQSIWLLCQYLNIKELNSVTVIVWGGGAGCRDW
jgi:hypothetical protein